MLDRTCKQRRAHERWVHAESALCINVLTHSCCSALPRLRSRCVVCADIHFQYNGFLLGLFLLSINSMLRGEALWGGFWFAVLLGFKHIFLYVAPVYFVFLLLSFCVCRDGPTGAVSGLDFRRFLRLGAVVLGVFCAALAPYVLLWNQGPQLLARLFPFQRGLCHAYWAPNVWVFYNLADKVLIVLSCKMGLEFATAGAVASGSTSSGLVADVAHVVLPTIKSGYTFVLTLATMAPVLAKLARKPHPKVFLAALIYCSMCSFMLGTWAHGRPRRGETTREKWPEYGSSVFSFFVSCSLLSLRVCKVGMCTKRPFCSPFCLSGPLSAPLLPPARAHRDHR